MKDLEVLLPNLPGSLATFGEILGKHKISLEGGGMFTIGGQSIAHFLIEETQRAESVLHDAGITVSKISEVVIVKLRQDVPGQLGLLCRRMASAGINILVQYSDHHNQLILVVDNIEQGRKVSDEWMKEWW